MRLLAALLATALVAPAHSFGHRRAPSPQPPPAIRIVPPPMLAPVRGRVEYTPSPAEIEASRAPEFRKCAACHAIALGSPNGMGPNLHGIFGRLAAAEPRYLYSPALRASGLVWDAERSTAGSRDRKPWHPGPR